MSRRGANLFPFCNYEVQRGASIGGKKKSVPKKIGEGPINMAPSKIN
jgi:hypothetical protein